MKSLYLLIDVASFAIPFLYSFEKKRIHFIGQWRAILYGLMAMSLVFIPWDILFTSKGVWGFNDRYILGIKISGLPLEEYLFFFLIGFCCLFVYETMNYFIKNKLNEGICRKLCFIISVSDILIAIVFTNKYYTLTALGLTGLAILIILWFVRDFSWSKFLTGYAFSFIPFMVVNGILTGSFISEPIVWYQDDHNLGYRLGTIPVEDSQYMMLMMLIMVFGYEKMKKKSI